MQYKPAPNSDDKSKKCIIFNTKEEEAAKKPGWTREKKERV
jgi:hypothetical protein